MNSKIFYLIYGAPGSGKSTFVEKNIKPNCKNLMHYEADMFFYDMHGNYNFNPMLLNDAHKWCQNNVLYAMKCGNPVCVSNTSLIPKERSFYLKNAIKYGYKIYVHKCIGKYKNIHGVPKEKVDIMRNKCLSITNDEIFSYGNANIINND